jgi:hypothetical protein
LLGAGTCLSRALVSIALHETPHLRATYLAQTFGGGLVAGLIISSCLWWRFERRRKAAVA